ncbi:major facilitator superfamily domain-containing protein [Schizophyllum amplum]|uniref:Major facilitator superfamily domain-containing protein n=1 Tax=Schizophyllum amplum TaxID=97359 RepID=A0A550C119_9AGAR|nr:major facilitator superfamily domain-containing protein [Auriculariopsis ampla]TRM58458.1 major facilitator superfamily domain-containing protein [Auriculariopsis ampla]
MSSSPDIESIEKEPRVDVDEAKDYVIDAEAEKRLRRKLDWRILPVITITYTFLFLDRGNVGNARSAGLVEDLGLGTFDFNIGTSLFYLMYLIFEIPFALLIRKVGFQLVPISIIGFGVVTISTAFIHNKAGFYITRIFLGIAEAVTYPGLSYLLTRYYRRHELTSRVGCFMLVAAGCAGGFGGLLAAGLLSVNHIGSRRSWENIFLVEGILTAVCGIVMLFIFPADPEQSRMLTPEERQLAIARLYVDQPEIKETKEHINWSLIKRGVFSPTTLACSWLYIVDNLSVQGLGVFLPSILKLNYPESSTVHIQLLAVPVYIVAMVVSLACTLGCIKYRVHWPFTLFGGVLTLIGYSIWISTPATAAKARYAACFLNLTGGFINGPVVVGWAAANASPDTLRAMVGAVVTGIGGIGSIAGIWAYVATDAPSGYHAGNSFNLAMAASLCACCIGLYVFQRFENTKRETGGRDYRLEKEGVDRLGNLHPSFRYIH